MSNDNSTKKNHLILDNPQYTKLIAANAISRFGDSIDMVAFSWLTYSITNSAAWSAMIVGVNQLVSVLFQPFVGSIVESMDKKKVMVCADIIRFLTILVLFITYRLGVENPMILVCFTAIISFIETFRIPAGITTLPALLEEHDYEKGVSINNSLSKCCELFGLLSAASIIALLGADGAVMVDGVTFLVSGIILATIPFRKSQSVSKEENRSYLKMTVDGAKFLWKEKALLVICIICGLINASIIPFDSLQSAYINLYFESKVQILSAVSIAISIGMLLGSMVYQFLPRKLTNTYILGLGGAFLGVFYITAYIVTALSALLITKVFIIVGNSFFLGIALAFMNNYVQIFFIKKVDKEYLSRISSISTTITTMLSPLTAFAVGLLATMLETHFLFLIWGILVTITFVGLCCFLVRITK